MFFYKLGYENKKLRKGLKCTLYDGQYKKSP